MAQQITRGLERLYLCYDSRGIRYFYRMIGCYILVSVAIVARRSLDTKGRYRISGGSDSGSRYTDSISGICAYRCKCGTIACYRADADFLSFAVWKVVQSTLSIQQTCLIKGYNRNNRFHIFHDSMGQASCENY